MKLRNRILIPFFAVSTFLWVSWVVSLQLGKTTTRSEKTFKFKGHLPSDNSSSTTIQQEDWQEVTGSVNKFIVYSAYSFLGNNNTISPSVLIIGITKKTKKMKDVVYCKFSLSAGGDGEQSNITVAGNITKMRSGDSGLYVGVFVRCPLPIRKPSWKPELVSVLLNKKINASNYIQIQYLDESDDKNYQFNFSVCVKPTFNLNNVIQLVEWMEFYKLMGVKQFTLYNMTIGGEAGCILRDLMKGRDPSIKVNVYPWHNPQILDKIGIDGDRNTPQCATAAAQNDCVYRHRGRRSKYMAYVDLDEFIMPREDKAKNFQEMIKFLNAQHQGQKYGEYQFRNGFFVLSRPDDPMLLKRCSGYREKTLSHRICKESLLMRKVLRDDYQPYKSRTKYIIKPEWVKEASNHFILEFEKGYQSLKVPESIGFLRHYRQFKEGSHTQTDQVALEFGIELVDKISQHMEYYQKICNLKI